MNTTIKSKWVNIRKPHICVGCGKKSNTGDKMHYHVSDFDGFQANYWCIACWNFQFTLDNDDLQDGFQVGDFWEFPNYRQFREDTLQLPPK